MNVMQTLLNAVFRCFHRHLTRPITSPAIPKRTYVVCLDCGKQFAYDLNAMRIGVNARGSKYQRLPLSPAVGAPAISNEGTKPKR